MFDTPAACAALLAWAGLSDAGKIDYPALREASLDRLADTMHDGPVQALVAARMSADLLCRGQAPGTPQAESA